jgi:amino acid transporter
MATWMPLAGAIPTFCSRYVDPALGFAVGWNVSQTLEPFPES